MFGNICKSIIGNTSNLLTTMAEELKLSEKIELSEKDRQPEPATGCKATIEGLYESKYQYDETDDCPNCMKLNVLCFVSNHRRRKTGKYVLKLFSFYVFTCANFDFFYFLPLIPHFLPYRHTKLLIQVVIKCIQTPPI